jgi:tetratricopeptide (TPR) repeat protein
MERSRSLVPSFDGQTETLVKTFAVLILLLSLGAGTWWALDASGPGAATAGSRSGPGSEGLPVGSLGRDAAGGGPGAGNPASLEVDLERLGEVRAVIDRPALVALLQRLKTYVAVRPDDGRGHIALSEAARLAGELDLADTHGERAVELLPEDSSAHFTHGKALGDLIQKGSKLRALWELGTYKSRMTRAAELGHLKAQVERIGFLVYAPSGLGKDLELARQKSEQMVVVDRRHGLLMLALTQSEGGRAHDAMQTIRDALEEFPGDQALSVSLGRMAFTNRRTSEAERNFGTVLAGPRSDKYYQALYWLCRLQIDGRRKLTDVRDGLQEYIAAEPYGDFLPGMGSVYGWLGRAQALLGDIGAARQAYVTALALDPDLEKVELALEGLPRPEPATGGGG